MLVRFQLGEEKNERVNASKPAAWITCFPDSFGPTLFAKGMGVIIFPTDVSVLF